MNVTSHSSLCRVGVAAALTVALTAAAAAPANAAARAKDVGHRPAALSATVISPDETVEPRVVPWATILATVVAAGGAADYMGRNAAERMYHAGLRLPEYEGMKWSLRASAIGLLGPIFGTVFMVAFENKFYSMV